jgi:uncharacterized protein (TIGR03437 family)
MGPSPVIPSPVVLRFFENFCRGRRLAHALALAMLAAGYASAQSLSLVSGDGQVAAQNFPLHNPLVVVAKDASGKPAANVPVNWTAAGPGTLVLGTQTLTDSSGQASNIFVGATIYGDTAFTQTAITASTAAGSVTMYETTSGWDANSGFMFVQAQITSPVLGDVITGPSGAIAAAAVELSVYGVHQAGVQRVPNVAMRLIPDNPGGPSAACAAGTGVTDVNGIARCRVVLSGPTGNGTFSVEVGGGFRIFSPFKYTVTAGGGQPAVFRISITGGNGQSGPPNAQLPARLTARVEDASGNPLPNVPVVWAAVNPQAVSLSGVVSASDASGIVSATAILGSVIGPAQVQVSSNGGAVKTFFNLTVNQSTPPPGGGGGDRPGAPAVLRIISGNNQSGPAGSRLPLPLMVRVEDASGNPVPGMPVTWESPPSVTLSAASTASDANGIVSATVTLGGAAGSIQVTLRTTGGIQTPFGVTPGVALAIPFNLTILQTPVQPATPAVLRITGGNNQLGPPGAPLPLRLTARVEDAGGNPVPNVAVIWQPFNPQAVTLSGVVSTSDANGIVSATATLGAVGLAQVLVRVPNQPLQAVFSLQSTVALTGIVVSSGSDQVAAAGSAFAQPVIVQVLAAEGAAAGLQVQFSSLSPSVIIPNGGLAVTDSGGRATIFIQAGLTPGTAIVTAAAGRFSVSFFLTALAPASPLAPLNFFNGASGQQSAISPTEILSIYGAGFAPIARSGCATPDPSLGSLPLTLSGVTVQFASDGYGSFAPLFAVCNLGQGQEFVVVETPADLPLVETTVTILLDGAAVAQSKVSAAPASPGVFETIMSDGVKRAVARHADGSYVSLESPAQRGERLYAYVTGLGRPVKASGILINTNQSGTAGDDASPPNPVSLRIGSSYVWPVSSIFATDTIGVYLVTFDLPDTVGSGPDVEFAVSTILGDQTISGKTSQLPIQ